MDLIGTRMKFILVVFAIAVAGVAWWLIEQKNTETESLIKQSAESPNTGQPVTTSSSLGPIRHGMRKDPAGSLEKLDVILDESQNSQVRKEAEALAPELILLAFYQSLRDEAPEAARQYLERLQTEYAASPESQRAASSWGRHLGEKFLQAVKANDPTRIEKLYEAYTAGGYYLPTIRPDRGVVNGDESVLDGYAQWQAEQWAALPEDDKWSEKGKAILARSMHAWLDHNASFQRLSLLSGDREEGPTAKTWLALANEFLAQEKYVPALNAFLLTQMELVRGRPWDDAKKPSRQDYEFRAKKREDIQSRITDLTLYLTSLPAGEAPSALPPRARLAMIKKSVDSIPNREKLERADLALAVQEFLSATEPIMEIDLTDLATGKIRGEEGSITSSILHKSMGAAREIRTQLAKRLLELELRKEESDLSRSLSPELLALVEEAIPAETPVNQLDSVRRRLIRQVVIQRPDLNPIPLPHEFLQRYYRLLAVNGLDDMPASPETATADLRQVIRKSDQPELVSSVREALQAALRRAEQEEDLASLIQLAGFYSAEFGDALDSDPFAGEYLALLQKAAGQFKDSMKYLFVQALIATGFPDDPAGMEARKNTIEGAFQAVASVPMTPTEAEYLPSTLPQRSSESIDNSTDHHLLAVYDGPEKFFVLCAPRRKGSLPLNNGTYRIAVMTPIGSIQPFRTERSMENQHAMTNYYVRQSGSNDMPVSRAIGDYRLLRQDAGNASLEVDDDTGLLRQ